MNAYLVTAAAIGDAAAFLALFGRPISQTIARRRTK